VDNGAGIRFYILNRSDATRTTFDSPGTPYQRNTQVSYAYDLVRWLT
jgi:hypothetical protein